jgi:hypothetical protein
MLKITNVMDGKVLWDCQLIGRIKYHSRERQWSVDLTGREPKRVSRVDDVVSYLHSFDWSVLKGDKNGWRRTI